MKLTDYWEKIEKNNHRIRFSCDILFFLCILFEIENMFKIKGKIVIKLESFQIKFGIKMKHTEEIDYWNKCEKIIIELDLDLISSFESQKMILCWKIKRNSLIRRKCGSMNMR